MKLGLLSKSTAKPNEKGLPTSEGKVASSEGKLPRGESTPRADIALPKKEKR